MVAVEERKRKMVEVEQVRIGVDSGLSLFAESQEGEVQKAVSQRQVRSGEIGYVGW